MSILIKGMEMPKDQPLRIVLNPNGQLFVDHSDHFTEYEAVELPPHGRLIDADEFEKYVELEYETREISHPNWIKFRVWCGDQPTIIEAEE